MTAPTATTREVPAGLMLRDGFSSLITLAADADISFWEKAVTPPGIEGGEAIPQTTMHNVLWRTSIPRKLLTLTTFSCTAAYDPAVYDQIKAILNVHTTITVQFADGTTIAFYGFLKTFQPNQMTEGNQPEATLTFEPTNCDPTTFAEEGPVVSEVTGT